MREYLVTLDDAAFGAASPVTQKFISRSDPAAQWTGAHKGHARFAYATNYLIDTDHGVIVDVEATRAIRQAEVGPARTMLERTEDRFGLKPDYLTADSAYGSAESLAWLVKQKKITPHFPVFDKSTRTDGTFSRADFTFDPERDRYTCPAGKELVRFRRTYAIPRTGITAKGTRLYALYILRQSGLAKRKDNKRDRQPSRQGISHQGALHLHLSTGTAVSTA